jgi:hypothetical protein
MVFVGSITTVSLFHAMTEPGCVLVLLLKLWHEREGEREREMKARFEREREGGCRKVKKKTKARTTELVLVFFLTPVLTVGLELEFTRTVVACLPDSSLRRFFFVWRSEESHCCCS